MPASSVRPRRGPQPRGVARGLSIVELLIGVSISLFILAGASVVLTGQLDGNRRLLLEAQIQQDLRTVADMVARDIRRAGYTSRSYCYIWPAQDDAVNCPAPNAPNRYTVMTPDSAAAPGSNSVVYSRSTDGEGGADPNREDFALDADAAFPREEVGFRWNQADQSVEYMVGNNNWQALTDTNVMRVTQFSIAINNQQLPVPCNLPGCQAQGPLCGGPVTLRARDVTITIVAQAAHDANVQRSLRENVRLRNDLPVEQCP